MAPRRLLALAALLSTLAAGAAEAGAAEVSACAARSYQPAQQPPFGGLPVPPLEAAAGPGAPPGFRLGAREAIAIATGTAAHVEGLGLRDTAGRRAYTQGPCRWQVSFFSSGEELARVAIDDRTGAVLEAWSGHQVGSELARGYEGAVAQHVNAPYVWIPLCLLFLAPFVDPRRLGRLVHLDLLAILGLGASLYLFNRAEITASVALTYPVLGYVLVRMLWAGLRPRSRAGPLVPLVPIRWLAVAAVALALGRIALNAADSQVIDVGVAGAVGADRIEQGAELYEGEFSPGLDLRGDVYGPANYLAYVPFEQALPWDGTWGEVPAAHAAAIAFDLLAVAGLVLLGRRLRPAADGRALGIALAYAWLACPFTLYALDANANDALVAASVIGALAAVRSRARGALLAVGAAAKFGSAALAPLLAFGAGERRLRPTAVFTLAFAVTGLALFAPFLPDGGPGELYDRTLGYQAARGSPFSIWGQAPSLDVLQGVTQAAAVLLALAVALVPRRRGLAQVAALAAAVIVAVQLAATHWFYFYAVWFLGPYLAACFAEQAEVSRSSSAAPRAAAS